MSDAILSAMFPASPSLWGEAPAPQASPPAPTPLATTSEAAALRAAFPNSPELWGATAPTTPVASTPAAPSTAAPAAPAPSPTVADLFPASPGMRSEEAAPDAPSSTATAAPEGFDAADPAYQEFQAIATEARLPAEAAQKVLALHTKALDSHRQQFRALVAQWGEESKADPEIGGARYAENVTLARGMLERFGDAELREVLQKSGLGNHKAVIRLLVRVAQNR